MIDAKSARAITPGQVLRCHVVHGLQLRGHSNGASWLLYYRSADGKERRPRLGHYPTLTIESARQIARALLARVASGDDPAAKREHELSLPTVRDLCEFYLQHYSRPKKKPRAVEEDERNIRLHILPPLGSLPVANVGKADLAALHRQITASGSPVAANRVLTLLSGLFSLAEDDELKWRPANSNPARGIAHNTERKRSVHIKAEEFAAVGRALHLWSQTEPRAVAALYVMLYAGTRVTELVTAPRSALVGNIITLADHKSQRTGEARRIHLGDQAAALIRSLPDDRSGYLFGKLDRHVIFRVWERVRETAGIPHVRVQDLRRSFASVALSRAGASLDATGQLLGHADPSTTRGYAWLMTDSAQLLAQQTADAIDGLVSLPPNPPEKQT